jgi:hypothetical protein
LNNFEVIVPLEVTTDKDPQIGHWQFGFLLFSFSLRVRGNLKIMLNELGVFNKLESTFLLNQADAHFAG